MNLVKMRAIRVTRSHDRRMLGSLKQVSCMRGCRGDAVVAIGSRPQPLGLDQPAPDCVAGELDAVAHSQLVEDVLAVAFDRLDADNEFL